MRLRIFKRGRVSLSCRRSFRPIYFRITKIATKTKTTSTKTTTTTTKTTKTTTTMDAILWNTLIKRLLFFRSAKSRIYGANPWISRPDPTWPWFAASNHSNRWKIGSGRWQKLEWMMTSWTPPKRTKKDGCLSRDANDAVKTKDDVLLFT